MAGRLAGQSNASLFRRVLDRSRLKSCSAEIHSELLAHGASSREVGEEKLLADVGRFRSVRNLDPTSKDLSTGAAQDVSSSPKGNFVHFLQFSGSASSARAAGVSATRSVAVKYLHDLQARFGRNFHGLSTDQNTTHPTPGDLHLPKLVNPTTELVKAVCSILEKQEWGPDTVKELEEANVVVSPHLVQLIIQRISKDEYLAWNFFLWAREKASMKLSLRAYMALLDCVGRAENLELTKQVIKLMVEDGHRNSAWPYNNALKWFSHDVDIAVSFWRLMKENRSLPTVITYTRLIDVLAKHGRIEAASEMFKQMLQDGCPPNITTYNVLINAFGADNQPGAASELFDKLSELGCKPNYETYNALIIMHSKAGNREIALKYFNMLKATGADVAENVYGALQIPLPDSTCPGGPPGEKSADQATEDSVGGLSVAEFDDNFNNVSPGRLMNASILVRMLQKGEHLSVEEKLDKIRPRIYPKFVVQVMQRLKNPETALIFFDWAKRQANFQHNEYSYSMIISILGRSRNSEAIARILKEMYEEGIQINTPIFTALITCYGRAKSIEGALQLFQQMRDWGCKPDTITYTSLIHLLAKHGNHEQANDLFMEMQQSGCPANSHTYTVIIYNLLKSGKVTEAFVLLKQMPELGCKPTPVTYATLIHHCAKDGHVDLAKEILTMMENNGFKPMKTSVTDLDVALRKVGRLEEAEALVRRLKKHRIWDHTYKVPTEKVARELVFKNFLAGRQSSEPAPGSGSGADDADGPAPSKVDVRGVVS